MWTSAFHIKSRAAYAAKRLVAQSNFAVYATLLSLCQFLIFTIPADSKRILLWGSFCSANGFLKHGTGCRSPPLFWFAQKTKNGGKNDENKFKRPVSLLYNRCMG
ncbi:hypothetical protein D3C74_105380 [compost metagenome]